jgi:cysteine desulfurase
MTQENQYIQELKNQLWEKISSLQGIHLNGHPIQRLAGNLNISVEGVDGSALLLGLQPIVALSSGSACSSTSSAPSHVLMALGHSEKLAYASLRFGIGRFNTKGEIDQVAQATISTINALRSSKNFVKK